MPHINCSKIISDNFAKGPLYPLFYFLLLPFIVVEKRLLSIVVCCKSYSFDEVLAFFYREAQETHDYVTPQVFVPCFSLLACAPVLNCFCYVTFLLSVKFMFVSILSFYGAQ